MNIFPDPRPLVPAVIAAVGIAASACGGTDDTTPADEPGDAMTSDTAGMAPAGSDIPDPTVAEERAASGVPIATATLSPTEGSDVTGTVAFSPVDGGTRVVASVAGLEPGAHGFHIHENGDCSAPDASSAGGHFAPEGDPHGAPSDPAGERHVGDLGNLDANENGVVDYERVDDVVTLRTPNSILGRAVIVHEERDDLTSQPSGDAGPRQACGVISMQGSTEVVGEDSGTL